MLFNCTIHSASFSDRWEPGLGHCSALYNIFSRTCVDECSYLVSTNKDPGGMIGAGVVE